VGNVLFLALSLALLWAALIFLALWCFLLHREVGRLGNEVERVRSMEVELRRLRRVAR